MATYEQNTYEWMKRQGLGDKFAHAGIYCIRIDNAIVYIGKSMDMLRRMAQHYVGIRTGSEKKYRIMAEAKRKGHRVNFDVLYYAKSRNRVDKMVEIGEKEGEFIRQYQPVLNTQIPKEDDWHQFDTQAVDAKTVLESILEI